MSYIRTTTKNISSQAITTISSLHDAIIQRIGSNKHKPKIFDDLYIDDNKIEGFYTYKKEVYILDAIGIEIEFKSYDKDTQLIIHDAIMAEEYNLLTK